MNLQTFSRHSSYYKEIIFQNVCRTQFFSSGKWTLGKYFSRVLGNAENPDVKMKFGKMFQFQFQFLSIF